MVKLMETKMVL